MHTQEFSVTTFDDVVGANQLNLSIYFNSNNARFSSWVIIVLSQLTAHLLRLTSLPPEKQEAWALQRRTYALSSPILLGVAINIMNKTKLK